MKIPMSPSPMNKLMSELETSDFIRIMESRIKASQGDQYRHWDEIRYRPPPNDMSTEEWWLAIKMARQLESYDLPLTDQNGRPFKFMMPDKAWERVHKMDQRLGGQITLSEQVANSSTGDRYLVNSLMEEAITSSQLEGANTSRQVAKEMIRTGRPPRDKSEQMILNNLHAMNFIRDHRKERLTPEFICEVHRLVTDLTLDEPDTAGRIQGPDEDRVKIVSPRDEVLHIPPPANQLPERLESLCAFANGKKIDTFLHPVVRAIIIHFWLAYDHPFPDGNGRTARALFYWSMLSEGYWLAEFVTISKILKKAPSKYALAFMYTETDDRDVTYFIMHQLQVFIRAVNEFEGYLQRKMAEVQRTEHLLKGSAEFNHRQMALLSHALRHPDQIYTVKSHSSSHNVVPETARTDLLGLEKQGLLTRRRMGKAFGFSPAKNLASQLEAS